MVQVEVESNPNCSASDQFFFTELEKAEAIQGIRVTQQNEEVECDVVGVEPPGRFVKAHAVKVADSGSGFAFLIYGGGWGIRVRPRPFSAEPWDFLNKHQWGEAFKIYAKEDILYG